MTRRNFAGLCVLCASVASFAVASKGLQAQGEPERAMQVEEVALPEVGANEVLVLTMAAGVNFNGVWASRGKPVSVFKMHNEPFHVPGGLAPVYLMIMS